MALGAPAIKKADHFLALLAAAHGIQAAPFTSKKLFRDPGQMGLIFPRIGRARRMLGDFNRGKDVILTPIDVFSLAILPPNLLLLRAFESRTIRENRD